MESDRKHYGLAYRKQKRYHYFVAYTHGLGFGRCEITRDSIVSSIDDIVGIEQAIKRLNGMTVGVMNYQLLRSEEIEENK